MAHRVPDVAEIASSGSSSGTCSWRSELAAALHHTQRGLWWRCQKKKGGGRAARRATDQKPPHATQPGVLLDPDPLEQLVATARAPLVVDLPTLAMPSRVRLARWSMQALSLLTRGDASWAGGSALLLLTAKPSSGAEWESPLDPLVPAGSRLLGEAKEKEKRRKTRRTGYSRSSCSCCGRSRDAGSGASCFDDLRSFVEQMFSVVFKDFFDTLLWKSDFLQDSSFSTLLLDAWVQLVAAGTHLQRTVELPVACGPHDFIDKCTPVLTCGCTGDNLQKFDCMS